LSVKLTVAVATP